MMDWGNASWGAGDWIAMGTLMIMFWGGLIALGVWVVRSMRPDTRDGRPEDAGKLLAERFARGEIDGEEFLRTRDLLDTADSSSPG